MRTAGNELKRISPIKFNLTFYRASNIISLYGGSKVSNMEKNVREGYGKILGFLEQEIIEVLWSKGEATGKEIFDIVKSSREIALTTVLTVLERLAKKGLVNKMRGESVYIFKPSYTKDEFAHKVSQEVLKGIFEISANGASASFVDFLADTYPVELDRLAALIERKKKEIEKKERLK